MIDVARIAVLLGREGDRLARDKDKFLGAKAESGTGISWSLRRPRQAGRMTREAGDGESLLAFENDPADDESVTGDKGGGEEDNKIIHVSLGYWLIGCARP